MTNLILNDNDDENEEIHANFIDHEFSEVPLMQAHWGSYLKGQKPAVQSKWDLNVAQAVASIVDEGVVASSDVTDLRPKIVDKLSGRSILIDSGASRSVWPKSDFPQCAKDPFKALKAVNN